MLPIKPPRRDPKSFPSPFDDEVELDIVDVDVDAGDDVVDVALNDGVDVAASALVRLLLELPPSRKLPSSEANWKPGSM